MTPDDSQKIKDDIAKVIQSTVNGKIDSLHKKLDEYIEKDMEWKDRAQSAIDLGNSVNGFGKVVSWILVPISAIGACWGIITWIGGYIKK